MAEFEEVPTGEVRPLTYARLGGTGPLVLEHMLGPRLKRDLEYLPEHLDIDLAHTVMLVEQAILDRKRGGALLAALRDAAAKGPAEFSVEPRHDSMVLQVERYLVERVGEDTAGRMHVGRSRIDHNAAVARLAARNRMLEVHAKLLDFGDVLLALAGRHQATIMPGWTHLQHAQPWTFGHYLLRQQYMLTRHLERIEEAYARINLSSLGGAALVGTSWPLDRQRIAELLGHHGIVVNAHDAGEFTLDWVSELAATLSMVMVELGRFASDLYIWHSWEFQLIELDDSLCGTSSIMPQKKNPVVLEHVRAHGGKSLGWFAASCGVGRSTSSTDVDPAYSGSVVAEATDTTWRCTDLMIGVLDTLIVNEGVMRERAGAFWSTASGLADELARQADLPFRSTHHVVARLVRDAVEAGVSPAEATGAQLDDAAVAVLGQKLGFGTAWVRQQLDPEAFLASRATKGSTSPAEMARQLEDCYGLLGRHRQWQEQEGERVSSARVALDNAIAEIAGPT